MNKNQAKVTEKERWDYVNQIKSMLDILPAKGPDYAFKAGMSYQTYHNYCKGRGNVKDTYDKIVTALKDVMADHGKVIESII